MTTDDPVFRDAADWHARLAAPDANETDWAAFTVWLEGGAARRDAYTRIELLDAEIAMQRAPLAAAMAAAPAPAAAVVDLASARAARPGPPRWMRGAVAAAAAGVALLGYWAVTPDAPPAVIYATGAGEQRTIALADGTRAQLNAQSRIVVRYGDDARRVELAQGEAAFDVVHDPAHPFVVAAGGQEIRDVGTSFAVRTGAARVVVTVASGVVDLGPAGAPDAARARLVAGQQAVAAGDSIHVRRVDPQVASAWRQGRLVYADAPLGDVAADVARYVGRPIEVAPSAAGLRFTGALMLGDEPAMIGRLRSLLPIEAEPTAQGIRLVARPTRAR